MLAATLVFLSGAAAQIVSNAGAQSVIPGWSIQSTAKLPNQLSGLAQVGANVSSWFRVSARSTVFAGLIENAVFEDSDLFFSNNLETTVDYSDYTVPWLYREEFSLSPTIGQHYFLITNGITSRADIWVNGHLVADNQTQVGCYGGRTYEITEYLMNDMNCLLIQAHPTNYLRDFGMGFVDWNPYPPDNGTGVWRDVAIHQTGPVAISAPRVITDFQYTWDQTVAVTTYADVSNHDTQNVNVDIEAMIVSPDGEEYTLKDTVTLRPGEERTVSMSTMISKPQIWWPAQWGSQPLYSINSSVSVNGTVSDVAEPRSFGIRQVSSYVNAHNDTAFLINGHPFLVQGAGYSSDIFYRFDVDRAHSQLKLVLDMGLNTIRLEGKQEHPELYQLADEMGVMIMPGWECCDKWEGWTYNDEANGVLWTDADYGTANISMLHEAAWMQTHPSFLAFLVGSDYWPDDRATQIYVDALDRYQWPNPIIASAGKLSYPELLGPSGMKMDGPYDWIPPVYWWGDELGAAFGFGSELGSGVGTPEIDSLRKFLSEDVLNELWQSPNASLYHMSTNVSSFFDRSIYNQGLFSRYGSPESLEDYLLKSQIMDYEAIRAQFEGFAARKSDFRPATGNIYWMLNGAWPNLHWQLFDYYLATAGSYFGTKVGTRAEHVVYSYDSRSVYLVNSMLNSTGGRNVSVDLVDLGGKSLNHQELSSEAVPNSSQNIGDVLGIDNITDVAFLKLSLTDQQGAVLSRNVYWLTAENDVLDWDNSSWYSTPVTEFVDMSALFRMQNSSINFVVSGAMKDGNDSTATITVDNFSSTPAFFMRMKLIDDTGSEVLPAYWTDNYVTLFPSEKIDLHVRWSGSSGSYNITVSGANIGPQNLRVL